MLISPASRWPVLAVLFSAILLLQTGCGKSVEQTEPRADEPLPPDIVADVNGRQLTREDAEREAMFRFRTMSKEAPPDRHEHLRQEIRRRVADQFVIRTLLHEEAERRGLKASEEEKEVLMARFREQLPQGQTWEDMQRASPARAQKLLRDMERTILINKLLETLPSQALTVSQEEVDRFYEGIRRARHILLKVEKNATPEARAKRRAEAETLRRQILNGEKNFAEAALRHSDCPSAQKGGYLGHFPRGQMVPEFDRAAFSQAVGEVGPIVETEFGYHIILVLDNDIANTPALAEEHVRRNLAQAKQAGNVDAFVNALRKDARIRIAPEYKP